jgi:hypothetical protein
MKTELYVIIAVLLLLSIIMVWWGVKTFLDIRRRQKEWKKPHPHSQPHPRTPLRGRE